MPNEFKAINEGRGLVIPTKHRVKLHGARLGHNDEVMSAYNNLAAGQSRL